MHAQAADSLCSWHLVYMVLITSEGTRTRHGWCFFLPWNSLKMLRLLKFTPFADCAYGRAGWHSIQMDLGGGSHDEVDAPVLWQAGLRDGPIQPRRQLCQRAASPDWQHCLCSCQQASCYLNAQNCALFSLSLRNVCVYRFRSIFCISAVSRVWVWDT